MGIPEVFDPTELIPRVTSHKCTPSKFGVVFNTRGGDMPLHQLLGGSMSIGFVFGTLRNLKTKEFFCLDFF